MPIARRSASPSFLPDGILQDASSRANSRPDDSGIEVVDLTKPTASSTALNAARTFNSACAPPSFRQLGQTAPKTQAPGGTKRKAPTPDNNVDLSAIDTDGMVIAENADQVRRKIRRLLDNGGMKVGEFCNTIGVSNVTYNRFMKQNGPTKGIQSDVFQEAWSYFKKRELAGLKLPIKASSTKKAKPSDSTSSGCLVDAGANVDISGIHLPSEEFDEVPVYDTCDDIRRKIDTHLRRPDVTQAQFCRDLHAQTHEGASMQSTQLNRFRGMSGHNRGAASKVFYAAYVFFEKRRIAEGKPKSKKREEMEGVWRVGFDRRDSGGRGYLVGPGMQPYVDQYGRVRCR